MVENTRRNEQAIIKACDWKASLGLKIIDIGAGKGHFLQKILQKNNKISSMIFETPKIIEQAKEWWKDYKIKVELIQGNFFKSVPPADVYILKHIIHDWEDENAKIILKSVHEVTKKVKNSKY